MAPFRNAHGTQRVSARLIVSYVFDWIVIVAIALIGYGFYHVHPHAHAFSLLDLSISYPYKADTVSITVAAAVAVLVPAVITFAVILFFVPGPAVTRRLIREGGWKMVVKMKLWEWNTAWLGLALSLAAAFTITQGAKLFGKPRPNMLARCQPDLSAVSQYAIGGYGQDISSSWVLVTRDICTNPDIKVVDDGFQSWPSGHSSVAWSGLLYFTLWLCAKFSVVLPYLPTQAMAPEAAASAVPAWKRRDSTHGTASHDGRRPMLGSKVTTSDDLPFTKHRDEAAAPPVWLTFLIFVPCGGAVYICGSRYFDYAHHGFDILSGATIGIVTSYVAFRWYHLPIARGSGWSWGPRSRDRAFGVGVGHHGFVDEDRQFHLRQPDDVELGNISSGNKGEGSWRPTSSGNTGHNDPGYLAADRGYVGSPPGMAA